MINSLLAKFTILWLEITTLVHTGICLSILNPSQPSLMQFIDEVYKVRIKILQF